MVAGENNEKGIRKNGEGGKIPMDLPICISPVPLTNS